MPAFWLIARKPLPGQLRPVTRYLTEHGGWTSDPKKAEHFVTYGDAKAAKILATDEIVPAHDNSYHPSLP